MGKNRKGTILRPEKSDYKSDTNLADIVGKGINTTDGRGTYYTNGQSWNKTTRVPFGMAHQTERHLGTFLWRASQYRSRKAGNCSDWEGAGPGMRKKRSVLEK